MNGVNKTRTPEQEERRRKRLIWEAEKIAEDPLWKVKENEKARIRANDRYKNDPQYAADVKRRALERQARRIMSGEHKEYHRQYRDDNREHLNSVAATKKREKYRTDEVYREAEKAKARAGAKTPGNRIWKKGYRKMKRDTDPNFKIADNCRRRINSAIKGADKSANTLLLLGCSLLELKTHLESLFTPGMSWDTYGRRGWHIDHRKPCDSFDLSDPIQQAACFHYTNLQPLWREHNQSKGNRAAPRPGIIPEYLDVI